MKTKQLILLLILIFISSTYAQTIYQAEPGTKGNKILLTIANSSSTLSISELIVKEVKRSEYTNFLNNEYRIPNIEQGSEEEIEIVFDISNNAPVNKLDTLQFNISNKNGENWTKEIVLEYQPPKEFVLHQNYPNPFNPATIIQYSIADVGVGFSQRVKLTIFDILGREVATLVNEEQDPGNYEIEFNGSNLTSGVYYYTLKAGTYYNTKKMLLIK